jgi:integrase
MQVISEGPIKITKGTIEAAWRRRGANRRRIIRDLERRGLALIVNATAMRWEYSYRPRGIDPHTNKRWPNRTVTLGNPATVSPDDARASANELKGQVQTGGDPVPERKAAAKAEQHQRALTLRRLLGEYARALPLRQKMRGDGELSAAYVSVEVRQVQLALEAIDAEDKPVSELTDDDVRASLKVVTGPGGNARARFGALTRFMDWCVEQKYVQVNPCTQISRERRPRAPRARKDYLTPDKLAMLWRAAETLREPVWRDIAQFLIALPCRRGEAANLDWSHLDLAAAEWHQPGQLTKNDEPHRLYLHPLALSILIKRYEAAGKPQCGLVFPGPRGRGQILNWGDLKAMLVEASGLTGWRWHDFRRSFATALGEAGVVETIADAVLNHRQSATRGGVLGVYQRAARWPEQVRAMKLWGEMLAAALEGRTANVTDLETLRAARVA